MILSLGNNLSGKVWIPAEDVLLLIHLVPRLPAASCLHNNNNNNNNLGHIIKPSAVHHQVFVPRYLLLTLGHSGLE